ncbi:uncharacterized protein LOC26525968 [Drosophila erecta]|uniref:SWIM-type domain-containing protein n=1 Tax=Drosophila erecta TaxID=7220 RepID=A0A0Q5W9D4_DROER|nr:uncharacterized protein LOC26525968 [Drosophila erecta]KQS70004.1 uncharacterized protein Dere_GG26144 [Drosophila erecta]
MAFESDNTTSCFVPHLVDQVFQLYRSKAETKSLTGEERGQLFYDLSTLLGQELVLRSLHLLDDHNFTFFHAKNNRSVRVVEISKGNEIFRLIPGVSFCQCEFFQCHVLQLPRGILYHDVPSGQPGILEDWSEESRVSYTCQHILALRLHQFLKHTGRKTTEQTLKKEDIKELQTDVFRD